MDKKQILKNSHIPTSEIEQDITVTKGEVDDFIKERDILMKNPPENKVRIYMLAGHISRATTLINKLNEILDYRSKQI